MNREVSLRGLVSGRVQGVGFRYFVQRRAQAAGLRGFVRNLRDGRVEFLLQGSPAAVDAVLEQIRSGPPHARVSELSTREDNDVDTESGFAIR
jgi:acylphosphatase